MRGDRARADEETELVRLLRDVARHDEQAFEQLYRLTIGLVTAAAFQVLRQSEQAAEVAQDTFLQVWQQAGRYSSGRGTALTWLAMIAHHRAVDRVRSQQAAKARETRWAALADTTIDDAADQVALLIDVQALRAQITALPPIHQEALQLAYLKQLSHSQIASQLNLPLGTVKGRVRDGLLRLRQSVPAQDNQSS